MENVEVDIVDYQPSHQPSFEKLNRQWIEQYFWMEPIDYEVLQHPDKHILAHGGSILVAEVNSNVAGVVALKLAAPGVYEFTKMAVDENFRGKQIGRKLSETAINRARALGAAKIILYSNTLLAPAIELYRKLGFIEVPVDGVYKRSNIKMEMLLK
jgi:N-acetylglutamate synthase-like GNAT family acetyltransferase